MELPLCFLQVPGADPADRRFSGALAGYAPQDPAISISSLRALWTALNGLNESLPTSSQVLADAIRDRRDLHLGDTGLKFIFDGVKQSVKGQYGHRSLQYKAVSGIRW